MFKGEAPALAADWAHHAYELSDSDQDRTAALIHEGLCLREVERFENADEVLKLAGEYAEDQGIVAYHRGRVQFEWGEYIEALDRFEEALASGSQQVPLEDRIGQSPHQLQRDRFPPLGPVEQTVPDRHSESPVDDRLVG